MYLIRNGKIEFSGSKHSIIEYILEVYGDDYEVTEYKDQMEKDINILKNVVRGLNLKVSENKPKRKGK